MKALMKTVTLGALVAFAFATGLVRAQYVPGDNDQMSQYNNAVAPNDSNNGGANDNVSSPQDGSAPQDNDSSVSFQTFYDQLANQGTWIQTDKYGYVWEPTESDPEWRPYTYGHWVDTEAGMTWVSDEPFGWATYHYGRWVNLDGTGWVWVPGYTWAPAWVSWRESDEDVGWAPLPPETEDGIDYFDSDYDSGLGFHIGDDCDLAYGIGPWWYNFCPIAYIGDPYCWRHYRDHRDNFALIGRTRNITNINFRNDPRSGVFDRVSANGPSVAALDARSTRRIPEAWLTRASNLSAAGVHGNNIAVFAPRIDPATVKSARPHVVNETVAHANVNRGTNINSPLTGANGVRTPGATSQQILAAQLAQSNAVSGAKIARADSQPSRPLTRSLTSLQTATVNHGGIKSHTSSLPNLGSAFTGAGATHQAMTRSSAQSSFTGAPVTRHTEAPSSVGGNSYFTRPSAPSYYRQSSAPVFQASSPAYYHQSSTPAFHYSAPSYSFHPQSSLSSYSSSFHSYAPAAHYSAPVAHYSGGGFSGGGRSFSGGGGGYVSSGGGGGGHSGGGHR